MYICFTDCYIINVMFIIYIIMFLTCHFFMPFVTLNKENFLPSIFILCFVSFLSIVLLPFHLCYWPYFFSIILLYSFHNLYSPSSHILTSSPTSCYIPGINMNRWIAKIHVRVSWSFMNNSVVKAVIFYFLFSLIHSFIHFETKEQRER